MMLKSVRTKNPLKVYGLGKKYMFWLKLFSRVSIELDVPFHHPLPSCCYRWSKNIQYYMGNRLSSIGYISLSQPVPSMAMARFGEDKNCPPITIRLLTILQKNRRLHTGSFLFIFFHISQTSLNKIFNQKHQSCVCSLLCCAFTTIQ